MQSLATRKDHFLVSIIGVGFGLFLIPVLQNTQPSFWQLSFFSALALVAGFTIFANVALAIGGFIGHNIPAVWQFTKYAAAGSFNSLLDLGILNLLSFIFKIYQGPFLILFNAISFLIAISNSYFWHKFWSFKSATPIGFREYSKFLLATIGGLIINTSIVYSLTIMTPQNISLPVWENIAKLIAVVPTLIWNFFAYRILVFQQRTHD